MSLAGSSKAHVLQNDVYRYEFAVVTSLELRNLGEILYVSVMRAKSLKIGWTMDLDEEMTLGDARRLWISKKEEGYQEISP